MALLSRDGEVFYACKREFFFVVRSSWCVSPPFLALPWHPARDPCLLVLSTHRYHPPHAISSDSRRHRPQSRRGCLSCCGSLFFCGTGLITVALDPFQYPFGSPKASHLFFCSTNYPARTALVHLRHSPHFSYSTIGPARPALPLGLVCLLKAAAFPSCCFTRTIRLVLPPLSPYPQQSALGLVRLLKAAGEGDARLYTLRVSTDSMGSGSSRGAGVRGRSLPPSLRKMEVGLIFVPSPGPCVAFFFFHGNDRGGG